MTLPGRIVGLDVGDVRIGVAVSDPLGSMALPREVIQRRDMESDIAAIRAILEETGAIRIVAGVPLDQNGQPGPQAEKTLAFAERLREALTGIEVVTQDERYSTASAQRTLIGAGVSRKGRKKSVDMLAAQHILQTYMDRQSRAAGPAHD